MSDAPSARLTVETTVLGKPDRPPEQRRLGKFVISREIIATQPHIARIVLRDCIVVRAELRYDIDSIEYVADHPDFQITAEGEMLRYYTALIHTTRIGDDTVTYVREWKA